MKKSKKKNQKKKSYKKKGGVTNILKGIGILNKYENAELINKNNNNMLFPSINLNVILTHRGGEPINITINKTNIIPFWDLIQQKLYSLSIEEFFGEEFQSDNKVRNLKYDDPLKSEAAYLVLNNQAPPPWRRQFFITQSKNHRETLRKYYKLGGLGSKDGINHDLDEVINLSKITFGGLDETELNELKEIKSITYGAEAINKERIFDPDDSYLNGMQNDATISVETFYNEEDLEVQFLTPDRIYQPKLNLGKIYYGNITIEKLIKRIKHALKSRIPERPYIEEITKGETILLGGDLVENKADIYRSRIMNYNDPVENINGSINVIWRLAEKRKYLGYPYWDSEGVPKWRHKKILEQNHMNRLLNESPWYY